MKTILETENVQGYELSFLKCDLASLESVKSAADEFKRWVLLKKTRIRRSKTCGGSMLNFPLFLFVITQTANRTDWTYSFAREVWMQQSWINMNLRTLFADWTILISDSAFLSPLSFALVPHQFQHVKVELKTADNIEIHMGTNVLGHHYLVENLIPILLQTVPLVPKKSVRVVFTSSSMAVLASKMGGFEKSDPILKRENGWLLSRSEEWTLVRRYSHSKLCNILQANKLSREYGKDGIVL